MIIGCELRTLVKQSAMAVQLPRVTDHRNA